MSDITTVPELRRLLDAKRKVAVNNGECRGCIDLGTVADSACDACSEAAMAFDNALTDDTIVAMLTTLEAAEEHENTVAALSQMTPEAARADGMYPRVTDTSLTLSSALAPLFPKEGTDE